MRAAALALLTGCGSLFELAHVPDVPDGGDAAVDGSGGDPDLVAWYPLDSIVGNLVGDVAHGHNAVCSSGECPTETMGVRDGALSFAQTALLNVASTSAFQLTEGFTVTIWIRINPSSTDARCAVGKVIGPGTDNSWQLCIHSDNQLFESTTGAPDLLGPILPTGIWVALALTYDMAKMDMFVNGENVGSRLIDTVGFDDGLVTIGGDRDNNQPAVRWNGELDDVRIYKRVLSNAEILALAVP